MPPEDRTQDPFEDPFRDPDPPSPPPRRGPGAPPEPPGGNRTEGRVVVLWERAGGEDRPFTRQWTGDAYRRLRLSLVLLGVVLVLAGTALTVRTVQGWGWAHRIAALEAEQDRIAELARTLEEMEASYERLRGLFLPESRGADGLWLPPAGVGGAGRPPALTEAEDADAAPPATWPLVERGVLTQPLIIPPEGGGEGHPGVDLAVPSGSYFRAIGSGVVVDRGEDDIYGLYVVVEHPGGYRSLYAHASVVVAEPGRRVREGEVLGLTGSSGRSTAPHLHLEVTLQGEHLDPLSLLRRP